MGFSKWRAPIGLLMMVLPGAIMACSPMGKSGDSASGEIKYKEFKVEQGTFQVLVTANGVVKPIDRIELKSKASGQIEELPVEEGDLISKGDLIARLDQKDERTEAAQAQADLDIAKAELKQAQRNYNRRLELFDKNLISKEERDQSKLALAVAKGKWVRATNALERARERLSESIVRAPIDGTILKKYVEEGQIIASGVSNVSGGTPIADIADMRSVYVFAGVDEIDIGKVYVGQKTAVVADAFPDSEFQGEVVRISPEAKVEQNVTLFDVIVQVANKEGRLKSGMNTTLQIVIINKENVLLIPAVTLEAPSGSGAERNEHQVLVKDGEGFVPRTVSIGDKNFKQAEVLSGLKSGEILGVPMTSRLKEENEQLEQRIRRSRSFGTDKGKASGRKP